MHLVSTTRTKENKLAQLKTAKLGRVVLILHMPFPETSTDWEWGSGVWKGIQVRMLPFLSEILVNIWHSYLWTLLLKSKYIPEHFSHHPDPIYINQDFLYIKIIYIFLAWIHSIKLQHFLAIQTHNLWFKCIWYFGGRYIFGGNTLIKNLQQLNICCKLKLQCYKQTIL